MQGLHRVKRFEFPAGREHPLPEGWKPFAGWQVGPTMVVLARKWERSD